MDLLVTFVYSFVHETSTAGINSPAVGKCFNGRIKLSLILFQTSVTIEFETKSYYSVLSIKQWVQKDNTFEPNPDTVKRYSRIER